MLDRKQEAKKGQWRTAYLRIRIESAVKATVQGFGFMEDAIFDLEKKLLDADFCKDIKNLEDILSADFTEYGSSGKVHSRNETIKKLVHEDRQKIVIQNFKAHKLDENVYLATYISENQDSGIRHLRSSIWIAQGSRLQLLFHQGTPKMSPTAL